LINFFEGQGYNPFDSIAKMLEKSSISKSGSRAPASLDTLGGKTGQIDHPIPVQIDHQYRSKLTTTFQSKLTT
jgi:hypothetical protein